MAEDEQVTDDVDPSDLPVHVEGALRAEDVAEREGEPSDHIELEATGAGRPAGGRAAYDPMRVGQNREGMKERGTVDPDAPDPSGGPA